MTTAFFPHRDHDEGDKKPFYRRTRFWWGVLIVLVILMMLNQCSGGFLHRKHTQAISVVVEQVKTENVPIYLQGLGTVTPVSSITVRTQINGILLAVNFKEGQMVKKGDVLAQVDPRPYEALLMQYQGQLERDEAILANSQVDLQRYQTLWKQNSVAKQTLDTQASLVKQNTGTVQIDKALIQSTELNLTYARITSPIDGRIGLRVTDPGNYVQTSDANGIAVIDMLHPINVVFTLPEDSVQQVLEETSEGQALSVETWNRTQTKLLDSGKLLTMDNQIDPTTGTVKLKATFPNEKNLLFPNQFVNIKLLLKTLENAITVPTAAIQYGANGTFVYLVNEKDKTVSVQPVTVGVTHKGITTISKGLSAGQEVVTEGTDKLTDGSSIDIAKPVKPKLTAERKSKKGFFQLVSRHHARRNVA